MGCSSSRAVIAREKVCTRSRIRSSRDGVSTSPPEPCQVRCGCRRRYSCSSSSMRSVCVRNCSAVPCRKTQCRMVWACTPCRSSSSSDSSRAGIPGRSVMAAPSVGSFWTPSWCVGGSVSSRTGGAGAPAGVAGARLAVPDQLQPRPRALVPPGLRAAAARLERIGPGHPGSGVLLLGGGVQRPLRVVEVRAAQRAQVGPAGEQDRVDVVVAGDRARRRSPRRRTRGPPRCGSGRRTASGSCGRTPAAPPSPPARSTRRCRRPRARRRPAPPRRRRRRRCRPRTSRWPRCAPSSAARPARPPGRRVEHLQREPQPVLQGPP